MPLGQGNVKVDDTPVKLKQFITPFVGLKPQIPIPKIFNKTDRSPQEIQSGFRELKNCVISPLKN